MNPVGVIKIFVTYVLKAIYGVLVSVFPMVAAYLHPEVNQPTEPERGELPPPVVGNLRLAANQQLLSDRQAEVTVIVTQYRIEVQKFRDQFRDMRNLIFTPKYMCTNFRTGFIAIHPDYQEQAGGVLYNNLVQYYDSRHSH